MSLRRVRVVRLTFFRSSTFCESSSFFVAATFVDDTFDVGFFITDVGGFLKDD